MSSEKSKALFAQIAKSKEEVNKLKAELSEIIKGNFNEMAQELFDTYPELHNIGWRQYTPYFNDGESCEFSSHHKYAEINGNDEDYGESEQEDGVIDIVRNSSETYRDRGTNWEYKPNPDYNPYYKEIVDTVKGFLGQFDDDDMEDLFGDHVKVNITRDGVEVEEYDHD